MNLPTGIDDRIPAAVPGIASEAVSATAANRAKEAVAGESGLRVALLGELSFTERIIGGRRTYMCHHHQKGQFFHFGPDEYEVAVLLDGTRGAAEVARQLQRAGANWTADEIARLIATLVRSGLARVVGDPRSGSPGEGTQNHFDGNARQGALPGGRWSVARCLSPLLSQRLNLLDGERIAARWVGSLGPLFSPSGVLVWLLVVFSGIAIAALHRGEFAGELRRLFSPQSWPLLVVIWCFVKIAHEAGHAISAKRQGVRVGRAGIILFLLAPLAFVDVTDAWRLPRRWARIQIAMAGMYVELGIAGLAVWCWWWTDSEFTRHIAAQVFMLAGPATLIVNANPLLRLDGYYILADLLEIPNLRMHGRQRLLARLESWLFGRTCPPGLLSGWRASVTMIHAIGSVLFQFVWMGGVVISVSLWAGGAGVILGLVAVTLWGFLPLAQWVGRIRRDEEWSAVRPRVLALGGVACIGIGLLAVLPSPLSRRVPVVVQYRDQQIARAASNGFVVAVPVHTGQRVQAGELLVVMDDPELRVQKEQLALEAEAARLRSRRLSRDGQRALASAENERHLGLLRSLEELERQLDSLRICARRDGVVCSPRPERWLGRFARRGDVLLCVGEEASKEVLASIGGADFEAYLQAVERGQPCQVRLRGGEGFDVVPANPQPRVGQTIPHPALAVTAGGPLPVEPQTDARLGESFRLIAPRSESRSPLGDPVSQTLRSGQQGMLIIGDSRSLMGRAIAPLQQLFARIE